MPLECSSKPDPDLQLRPFQEEEVAIVLPRKRCGIIWSMGTGKTCLALTVGGRAHCSRWLVLAPTNAFSVWRDEPHRWLKLAWPNCEIHVHILSGPPGERELLWNLPAAQPPEVHIFVCTPETFLNDWAHKVKVVVPGRKKPRTMIALKPRPNFVFPQIMIVDEARRIRNRKSQAFQVITRFLTYYSAVEYFLPMSGTPGNQPQHLWAWLNLIAPRVFSSFWKFASTYHWVYDTPFGKEIGAIRNEDQWWRTLGRHCSVVLDTDSRIATQLPPLQRLPLEIPLDVDQARAYRDLEQDMLHITKSGEVLVASTTLALVTRLRQILICPKILSPSLGVGAAIKDVAEMLDPDSGENYVIFTPFVAAMPHFTEYLGSKGFKHVYSLHGSMSTKELDGVLNAYRANRGTMVCSLLYAQAFSLEPATKAFFTGIDWDPDNNRQAEARLRRLTSSSAPITAYYYVFPDCEASQRLYEIVVQKQERLQVTIPADLRRLIGVNKK